MDDLIGRDPQGLSTPDLVSAITELTGHLNAATHRWLHLVAEFDRRQGWSPLSMILSPIFSTFRLTDSPIMSVK